MNQYKRAAMPTRFINRKTKITYTLKGIQKDLPEDIFQEIVLYLDPKTIGTFQITSKFFRDIYKPILSQTPIALFIEMVQVQKKRNIPDHVWEQLLSAPVNEGVTMRMLEILFIRWNEKVFQ